MLTPLFPQTAEWQQTNGPLGGDVNAVIMTDTGTLIAGIRLGGLFRSTDGGQTWSHIEETSQAPFLFNGVWDMTKNSQGHLFAATNGGAYRSTDHGETWTAFHAGLTERFIRALAVNSSDVIFAGSNSQGVFRSDDNGETWTAFNNGLTDLRVKALAITPGGDVLTGTQNGLFISSDNGDNWAEISNGLNNTWILSLLPVSEDTLLAGTFNGAYLTTDHGANWSSGGVVFGSIYSLARQLPATLYAGDGQFFFRSTDNGVTWSPAISDQLVFASFVDLYVTPSAGLIAATANHGIVQSSDGGATWQHTNAGLTAADVVTMTASSSGDIFAGTFEGIYRTSDGGDTWKWLVNPDIGVNVRAIEISSTGRLFASINGIFALSDDNGDTWTLADSSLSEPFAESIAFGNGDDVYVGFYEKIFKSTDGGGTWSALPFTFPQTSVQELAVAAGGTVFAGTRSMGVFRSSDGGVSWQQINNGLGQNFDMTAFLFLPNGDVLVSGFDGVFRSSDSGDTWEQHGAVPRLGVEDLARDSAGNLYIAMRGSGVAVSEDDGATWTSINSGLWHKDARALLIDDADNIYVGTRGGSVFKAQFSPTSVEQTPGELPETFVLEQNFPNPFNPETRLRYRLASAGDVTLAVYNQLGQLVRTLVKGRQLAGEHSITWDARDSSGKPVASGVYLYLLSTGEFTQSREMALIR